MAGFLAEIRAVGGLGVIDWHAETSIPDGPRPAWGAAYQEILDLLAADPGLWVTDLGSIDRWLSERAAAHRLRAGDRRRVASGRTLRGPSAGVGDRACIRVAGAVVATRERSASSPST